jgi:hypothetical protein
MRPARLAAGVLLPCALALVLAPAHAGDPASPRPAAASRAPARPHNLQECSRLRAAILESEQAERRVRAAMIEGIQQDLSSLRQRFRRLGCLVPAKR